MATLNISKIINIEWIQQSNRTEFRKESRMNISYIVKKKRNSSSSIYKILCKPLEIPEIINNIMIYKVLVIFNRNKCSIIIITNNNRIWVHHPEIGQFPKRGPTTQEIPPKLINSI